MLRINRKKGKCNFFYCFKIFLKFDINNGILLNIYSYISNFRKPGDEPLGKIYPPNDKKWAKEILEYDSSDIMSPSIKEGRMCKYCHARLLPHESDGICCNHGQVIETRLLN